MRVGFTGLPLPYEDARGDREYSISANEGRVYCLPLPYEDARGIRE